MVPVMCQSERAKQVGDFTYRETGGHPGFICQHQPYSSHQREKYDSHMPRRNASD